jgi:phosphoribosylformylglycinamidine (FGAM) synthase-like amidotransferase family enzyme
MMPHPERLAEPVLGSDAGHRVFTSLIHHLIAEPSGR